MAKFVSHTNGTTDVGGGNNTMARGKSVVTNPIGDAAGSPNRGTYRTTDPKYAGVTGDRGEGVVPRNTPEQQHGTTGSVERAASFNAAGSDA
jgi:hypothetical protein|tara:strand:- start:507 stop:782 length:276 start_codon:yes stop_codon:yes gene_type:complete